MATTRPLPLNSPRDRPLATLARELALLVAGSLFLALAARISVELPFSPVPISGQTLGAALIGALYGPRRGALTVLLYLLEGLAGAPVFASGRSGPAVLLGPTGGYLVGFALDAAIAGLFGRARRPLPRVAGIALAMLSVYVTGVPWLMIVTRVPLDVAIAQGLAPFLIGDTIKTVLVAAVTPAGATLLARLGVEPR